MLHVGFRPGDLRGRALFPLLAGCTLLAACEGPHEQAGKDKDKAAAQTRGEPYRGSGPNQRQGQAQDRADDADRQLLEANSDVFKARSREIRRHADVDATRLDEQSKAIRASADVRARALETEGAAVRTQQHAPAAPST